MYDIFCGYTVIVFPKQNIEVNTFGAPELAVDTPRNESTVVGPQDSFMESLETIYHL